MSLLSIVRLFLRAESLETRAARSVIRLLRSQSDSKVSLRRGFRVRDSRVSDGSIVRAKFANFGKRALESAHITESADLEWEKLTVSAGLPGRDSSRWTMPPAFSIAATARSARSSPGGAAPAANKSTASDTMAELVIRSGCIPTFFHCTADDSGAGEGRELGEASPARQSTFRARLPAPKRGSGVALNRARVCPVQGRATDAGPPASISCLTPDERKYDRRESLRRCSLKLLLADLHLDQPARVAFSPIPKLDVNLTGKSSFRIIRSLLRMQNR